MSDNSIETSSPSSLKISGGNESGPGWQMTFVFFSNGATSLGAKESVGNVSKAVHGRHKVTANC